MIIIIIAKSTSSEKWDNRQTLLRGFQTSQFVANQRRQQLCQGPLKHEEGNPLERKYILKASFPSQIITNSVGKSLPQNKIF